MATIVFVGQAGTLEPGWDTARAAVPFTLLNQGMATAFAKLWTSELDPEINPNLLAFSGTPSKLLQTAVLIDALLRDGTAWSVVCRVHTQDEAALLPALQGAVWLLDRRRRIELRPTFLRTWTMGGVGNAKLDDKLVDSLSDSDFDLAEPIQNPGRRKDPAWDQTC